MCKSLGEIGREDTQELSVKEEEGRDRIKYV